MIDYTHSFHIPVMGTGHSVDSPIRVAPFGITSVISLVDDLLLEPIREYYCNKYSLPYNKIERNEDDGRARRITAYLDTVNEIVRIKMDAIKSQPFFMDNDKSKYFDLLPGDSPLKEAYSRLLSMGEGSERDALESKLTSMMKPGSIDVNIMVKLDRIPYDRDGNPAGDELSDAKTALRGYADSSLSSGIVFSAGINQRLYTYMSQFRDFYRDMSGNIKKKIIIKVSDFRSSLIQGKFLARKGLEVSEFRIESGLNCGGHAFATQGILLPALLKEFKEKRDQLSTVFKPAVKKYYEQMGWSYPESAQDTSPLITVQGGVGTYGEVRRLCEDFGMDLTGWASPFLLVKEATCVDDTTRELLRRSTGKDFFLSSASPLGIPFNNIHSSGSEIWTRNRYESGNPGSPCGKGFLVSNTDFTDKPLCTASSRYERLKLDEINDMEIEESEKERLRRAVSLKACICDHLGNGALIALGIADEDKSPQCVCPGPMLAWFDSNYTLKEMVDHIYGRVPSLASPERPHMFAKEIEMYVDYFEGEVRGCRYTPNEIKYLEQFRENLEDSMNYCLQIAEGKPYTDENLASIPLYVDRHRDRLGSIYASFKEKAQGIER